MSKKVITPKKPVAKSQAIKLGKKKTLIQPKKINSIEPKKKAIKLSKEDKKLEKFANTQKKAPLKANKEGAKLKSGNGVKINEKVLEKSKEGRFLTTRMYSYKLFNWLLKGNIDDKDPNLNGDSIQIGYSEIFTQKNVTRYYIVSYLQEDTPVGMMNYLISEVKKSKSWVNLSMQVTNKPYVVDFTASHLKLKLQTWTRILDEEYEDIEGKDGRVYTRDFEKSIIKKKTGRLFRSYFKIRENTGYVKESTIILKLQTRDKASMKTADKRLRSALRNLDLHFYQITGTLLDFLRGFSPVSKRHTVSNDTAQRVLMTNRDVVDLMPYRQGKIGDMGLWFGIDKYSGDSVWLDIMNTPEAKNILVMGLTGAGKTFFVSMLLFFHRTLGQNIFIHDHKGNEFTSFTRAVGGVVVSMTPSKTTSVNTFKLPIKYARTEEELLGIYREHMGLSELIFMTLTLPDENQKKVYKNLFADYMRHVHGATGIVADNVETYYKSEELTPNRLYDLYVEFSSVGSTAVIETYSRKVLTEIQTALYKYWHPKGSRYELFKNEINMDDIIGNKCVCFDYGMSETTRNSVPVNELKLKKIFMEATCSRYVNHNKKNKEYTVKVVEEIQSADDDILEFTSNDVTEGRAKNMINYVLGNATGNLASGSKNAKNIIENMNIQILGKLKKSARDFYVEQYELQGMEKDLERIATDRDYRFSFLLNCDITDKPSTAIVQAVTTERVAESKFFKTVDYDRDQQAQ